MKPENESGIAYLVIGLGLGLVAGMLLAPRRGQQTRNELLGGAAARLSGLSGEGSKLRSETHRWLESIKDRFRSPANGTENRTRSVPPKGDT